LTALDWSAAWLAPQAPLRAALAQQDWPAALSALAAARGVRTSSGLPLRFSAAADAGTAAYEAHIAATGRVPTRSHGPGALHDAANALMWLTWPRTKAALNTRQAQELSRRGAAARRGAVRDAATLLDESGLLLACTPARLGAIEVALARHDWDALLVRQRALWQRDLLPWLLGHALLEKLARPYKAITARVLLLAVDRPAERAAVDEAAAKWLRGARLAPARLQRLPLLGIPGWWPANAAPGFYDDAQVFRPARAMATARG
jgi:hypothetical protein